MDHATTPEKFFKRHGRAEYFAPNGKALDAATGEKPKQADQDRQLSDLIRNQVSAATLLKRELAVEAPLLGSLITSTSRLFLVGSTGTGKTMFGLAIAGGIASGSGFLSWKSKHASGVLYIDGEMPLRSLQSRVRDMIRRLDDEDARKAALRNLSVISWQDADALGLGKFHPLNTEAGQRFILKLCEILQPQVVIFDNVQALLTGDMKDEVPWNDAWPLISALTSKNIGQVWIDHTGHDKTRQYGTSTKAWRFDSVGIMTPLAKEKRAPGEIAFTLSFEPPGKARNRSPETWHEYETRTIRLRDEIWTCDGGGRSTQHGKVPPSRVPFYDALTAAIGRSAGPSGETTKQGWEQMCVQRGVMEAPRSGLREDERRKGFRRAQYELVEKGLIIIDGERVIDNKNKWA